MPQVAAVAAAWVGSAIVSIGGSAAIAATAANFVAAAGFAQGIGAALGAWGTIASVASLAKGKPRIGDQGKGTQVDWKADPAAGIPYAMGETGLAGNILFATTAETKNRHLLYLTALSGAGPIEEISGFRVNDTTITFSGENAVQAPFHNFMWSRWQLGSQTPTAFDPPATTGGALPEWTASHKLTGIAAQWWVLEYDAKVYPTGTPKPLTIGKWVKVYDPRKDSTFAGGSGSHRSDDEATWEWSDNPFLHGLTWCLGRHQNGKRILGVGAPVAMIDVAAFVEGANVCDANGWKLGGVVYSTDDKWQVLNAILAAGGGWPTALGAKISCGVNAPKVSLATMTGDDSAGDVTITALQSRRDRLNGAIPRYRSADHRYEVVAAAKVSVADYVTDDDGEDLSRELDFPLCPLVDQAAQLATYAVANSREFGPITVPAKPRWRGYRPNDCITVNEPEWGLNEQKMLILGESRDPATGIVTLTLQSETDGKHAFALGETGTPPPTPGLTGLDPTFLDPPEGGTYTPTPGSGGGGGGGTIPSIVITGFADNPFAAYVLVRYRVVGAAVWSYWPAVAASADRIEITGLLPDTDYEIEIAYRTSAGVQSAWVSLGTVTAGELISTGEGDTTPPAAPTGLTATGLYATILLSCTAPSDADTAYVEFWENTSNTQPNPVTQPSLRVGRIAVAPGGPAIWAREGLGLGQQRWYWARAVDRAGNASGFSASGGASATTASLGFDDFASGVKPLGRGSSLPTASTYPGDSFFLTTDGRIYRKNTAGTAWVYATPTTDLTGTITTTQIDDNAITTSKIAANAVTADEILAGSISASHIATATITATQLAADSITSAKILAGAVGADEIAAGAIVTAKITAGQVITDHLVGAAVTGIFPDQAFYGGDIGASIAVVLNASSTSVVAGSPHIITVNIAGAPATGAGTAGGVVVLYLDGSPVDQQDVFWGFNYQETKALRYFTTVSTAGPHSWAVGFYTVTGTSATINNVDIVIQENKR